MFAVARSKEGAARRHGDDLRAATKLVLAATTGVTDVIEQMHRAIASGPSILGEPLAIPVRVLTGLAYGHVRNVTKLVGHIVDLTLEQLSPLLGESSPGPRRDALLAALNGVLGDYLVELGSPFATEMTFRQEGRWLPLEPDPLRMAIGHATGNLLVMVHGSSTNDGTWARATHDHGTALARDLGYTTVYLRYNSGLHISTNGRQFARLLENLVSAWPTEVKRIAIVGHSMGGLVARSACHVAEVEDHAWRKKLRKLVCLGSPHLGSPLERAGSWVDGLLGVTKYSAALARLGKIRSAGVTDLRHGNVLDEDWQGFDRFARSRERRSTLALPDGVDCYAIAASRSTSVEPKLRGDGLVPVDSALGRHERADVALGFPEANQWIAFGANHLDLLARADVYEIMRQWLELDAPAGDEP
jgi:pimeloyl-ACP methyl ester carboxylesterase